MVLVDESGRVHWRRRKEGSTEDNIKTVHDESSIGNDRNFFFHRSGCDRIDEQRMSGDFIQTSNFIIRAFANEVYAKISGAKITMMMMIYVD